MLSRMQVYHGISGFHQLEKNVQDICQRYDYVLPEAQRLFLIALAHDRYDRLKDAIQTYQQCISQCTDEKDYVLKLHVHILLGSIFADQEDYQDAYTLYREVLDHTNLLDDNYRSLAYTNISDFHLSLGQFQKAYQLASLGEQSAAKVGNNVNQAICLLNMGYALGHQHDPVTAIGHIEDALAIAIAHQNPRVQAIAHGYIGQVMVKHRERYSESVVRDAFEKAQALFSVTQDNHNQLENKVHYALFLAQTSEKKEALSACLKLYNEIDPQENFSFYVKLCRALFSLLEQEGNQSELLKIQSAYIAISDKHFAELEAKEFQQILMQVEQATAEQERRVINQTRQHIGTVTEVGQQIATSEDLAQHLPFIYDKVCSIFPTDEFGIALYDDKTHILDYCYFYDRRGPVEDFQVNCLTEHSIGSYVIANKSTVHLNRINDDVLNSFVPLEQRKKRDCVIFDESSPVESILLTPIKLRDKVLGILSIQHHLPDQYHQHHRNLFEQLAGFIAIALENHVQRRRLEQANQKLDLLSKTDPLTGLYNRYQLDTIIPTLVTKAAEQAENLAAVMIDVDYYKGYNDFHGHHQGDVALKSVASLMKSSFDSDNDYLFRYGGDEFLAVCCNSTQLQLEQKLRTLQQSLAEMALPNPLSQCNPNLTLSIGAANRRQKSRKADSFDHLFNLADQQLYKVKSHGRNKFSVCTLAEPISQ
ncbi:GGDEF domain-containing protein [Vibrio sinensis]|uniref:diguanylate cyclase n=2 Tax=Vibrio sinensis TaxID=2302434 RepID=A0A3A6QZI1_9VIBR|nr:GGDEF domain-containing protein [Vibrio sinensis]